MTPPTYPPISSIRRQINLLIRTLAVMTLILMSAHEAMATTVTLMWDTNPESDIAGYKLSYGTQSGSYTTTIDVGNVTSRAIDFPAGQRYYVVAQAYNTSTQMSPNSAPEVLVDLSGTSAPVISSLSPTTGAAGTSVTLSGTNFGATQGSSVVSFNGTVATPSSWNAASIVVPVPAGATTGPVGVTVSSVASNTITFTVTTSGPLPAPWLDQDLGAPPVTGSATFTSGTFSVTGSGADIWDGNDQFHFVYQTLSGDGEIVARVASLQNTDGWSKAGVMIRQGLTGNAANALMLVSGGNGLSFQQRATSGGGSTYIQGPAGVAPQWVRLVRSGTTLTGYSSVDGTTWTARGSATITLPTQVYVGLAVTSHNAAATATATFSNVTVTPASPPPPAPSLTSVSPATGPVGTSVTLSGANFGATPGSSVIRFNGTVATYNSWSNTSIVVPVPANATTGPVVVTVGGVASNGVTFTVSAPPPGPSLTNLSPTTGAAGTSVTLSGTNFGSTQGSSVVRFNGTLATPSSWSNTSIVTPVPANATTGSVVVTVSGAASNGITFTVSASGGLPAPWLDQDLGAPPVTGSATFTSGTFSVTGSGADIWDVNDQFHFVYQPLNGDGEIVARVASLQNTDGWSKAGVMIRQDLAGNAPNAFMLVSATHGLTFQQRATRGAQSNFIQGPAGVAPQWLRIVRSGTTLTGYSSVDGTTWTARGSFTITLPTQVYIGLAVTSHNAAATATATFSNVTATVP